MVSKGRLPKQEHLLSPSNIGTLPLPNLSKLDLGMELCDKAFAGQSKHLFSARKNFMQRKASNQRTCKLPGVLPLASILMETADTKNEDMEAYY